MKHQLEVLYPSAIIRQQRRGTGPELMMMSAMMAAGRMRRRLVKGPQLHGPRGTVPAPQQLSSTSKRLHDVSLAANFFFLFDATLQRDLHLRKGKAMGFCSELWSLYRLAAPRCYFFLASICCAILTLWSRKSGYGLLWGVDQD